MVQITWGFIKSRCFLLERSALFLQSGAGYKKQRPSAALLLLFLPTSETSVCLQSCIVLDPYARAIISRSNFGELGPVRMACNSP